MGLFDKLFGKKEPAATSSPSNVTAAQVGASVSAAQPDPAHDPDMMKVIDEYGREMFVRREEWRDKVLLGHLEKHRDKPDELYTILIAAVEEGFAADVVGYAEHLKATDTEPSRGAVVLAIIYMKLDRLNDAQRVLEECVTQHGEDAVVLTNLAKIYSLRSDDAKAESILWHALELDPNQDNALALYAAIRREKGGEAAELEVFNKVAALPGSWRARLWIARDALQHNDLPAAETLYNEALALAGEPVPYDLLMQMSGDLGNSEHVEEIVRLVRPLFDAAHHGLSVGGNLIKASLALGQVEDAQSLLSQLYDQKRPEWKQSLAALEGEIAKADTARRAAEPDKPVSIAMLNIEGPLWMRDGAPFASLIQPKSPKGTRIAVFGSTVLIGQTPAQPILQVGDAAGRLSRAIPLWISEMVHLTTDAAGIALIPWAQGKGFALFGNEYSDSAICEMVGTGEDAPDYIIGVTLDTTQALTMDATGGCIVSLRMLRRANAMRIGEMSFQADLDDGGGLFNYLSNYLDTELTMNTGVRLTSPPAWYQLPAGADGSDYLLRLEQQLSVACNNLDFLEGARIFGEREMLDGIMQLCVGHPHNATVRMLFGQTLRLMKKAKPEVLPEYREKVAHLQRDYPISEDLADLVEQAVNEVFAG